MTDTGTELSEILSETPAAAVVTGAETTTTETPPATADQTGRLHGADGKFAPKAGDTIQTEQQPASTTQTPPATTEEQPGMVPQQALHAARQENADLKRRLEMVERSVLAQPRQQPPAQQQEQPQAKDFWEDPDGFVAQRLSPLEKTMQRQRESVSRMLAVSAHGADTVNAAFEAIKTGLMTNPGATSPDYQRIMASEHPFDELVQWHKRNQNMARVGSDPDKWLEAELEKRLADPAKQAEILARIQASAAAPTNRSTGAPVTALPPSLNRIPGGANEASAGLPDDSTRFAQALAATR